jgi:isocitrate dehydrogenase (NAD+)
MRYHITLIPGDGIGPEVTDAVQLILARTPLDIEWDRHEAGIEVFEREGTPLPQRLLDSIQKNRVALKGPIGTPIGGGISSVNVQIRRTLNLYANLRPVFTLPGIRNRFDDVDLIVIRENTEDLYSGLEHEIVPGVVESLKVITRTASERIARFAFEYARQKKRRLITAVHKANILKLGDGLFLESVRTIAREFEEIEYNERIVDATSMQLVQDPSQFDILLLPNLYGDIVSDLCAGLVGGLGLVPSGNIGENIAVFEAVHGTAPDIAGQQLANPTALLISAVFMLRHLGEDETAERVMGALYQVLKKGRIRTCDIGGTATTTEFAEAIAAQLDS